MAPEHERRLAEYERQVGELQSQLKALEEESRRPPPPPPGRPQAGPDPRGAPPRDEGPARPGRLPERAALGDAPRGPRAHRGAARRGREAHDAARRRTGRSSAPTTTARSTSSPPAARCASRSTPRSTSTVLERGQEVALNESLNVVLARGLEVAGEVVVLKELLEDEQPGPRRRARRRGAGLRAGRASWSARSCGPATTCSSTSAPAWWSSGCPAPRSRSSSSRRSPTSATPTSAASTSQIEQIRDAVELPYLYADLFFEHELQPPKGILLYGPPGLRQDAHRQGRSRTRSPTGSRRRPRTRRPARTSSTSRAPSC